MARFGSKDEVQDAAEGFGVEEDVVEPEKQPDVEGDKALVERATITDGTDAEAQEPDRSDLNLVTDLTGRLIRVEKVGV